MLLRDRPPRRLGRQAGAPVAARGRSRRAAAAVTAALALSTLAMTALACGGAFLPAMDSAQAASVMGALPAVTAKEQPEPKLSLAPVQAVLLSNDDSAEFELWLENPADDELPAGHATLSLDPTRITDAAGLDAEFPNDSAIGLVNIDTPVVPAGEGRLVQVAIPREQWPLTAASDAGVYRVHARLAAGSADDMLASDSLANPELISATAPLVWRGAGGLTSVKLTTIVPMLLPNDITSLPRRGQLDELMGPGSQLDSLLTSAEARGATLAIDPRVVAGVRVYGESASEASRSFVDRLNSTSVPSFALQFADADPSAQAALGFSRLLAPEGLSFATRFGTFTPQDPAEAPLGPVAEDPAADQAPADETPGAGDAPGLSELTSVDASLPNTAWPAAGSVNDEVLDLLVRNGNARVVATAPNVGVAGGAARGTLNGVEYLVSDDALDAAALAALSAGNETAHSAGVARLSALLALRAQAGVPGAVLTFDRGATSESLYANELLNTVSALPWVEPVSPEELPEGAVSLHAAEDAGDPTRITALRDAVAREPAVRDYSRVLVDPLNLVDLQRVRLLQLFSTRYTSPGADFSGAAKRAAERDAETLDGVHVVTTTRTQLVGTTSLVPIQVRNTLPFDALLQARVVPTNPALIVTNPKLEPTLIPSESSTNVLVPVRARVSSGESWLAVDMSAVTGGAVVTSGMLAISIRSSWESLALGSLGLLTAAFFGFGIWRSVRRRSSASADGAGILEP